MKLTAKRDEEVAEPRKGGRILEPFDVNSRIPSTVHMSVKWIFRHGEAFYRRTNFPLNRGVARGHRLLSFIKAISFSSGTVV